MHVVFLFELLQSVKPEIRWHFDNSLSNSSASQMVLIEDSMISSILNPYDSLF